MKGKLKQTKGITLIALIITIIILLILAIVSIRLVMNNGILGKAESATTKYGTAEEQEQIKLGYADYQMAQASGKSENLTVAGADVTGSGPWVVEFKTGNQYTLSADGKTITATGTSGEGTNTPSGSNKPPVLSPEEAMQWEYANKILSDSENTEIQDGFGNKIVVPAGFKIKVDEDTNYATHVIEGIVVTDGTNEFVWIGVGNIKTSTTDTTGTQITLGRYSSFTVGATPVQTLTNYSEKVPIWEEYDGMDDLAYSEDTTSNHNSSYGNAIAKDIKAFLESSTNNGGYYLGRYEARTATERTAKEDELTTLTENKNDYVYNWVTQPQASELSQGMYVNKPFASDLINGYAWDTAIMFIENFGGNSSYAYSSSVNSWEEGLANKGTDSDKISNIYDMASNCEEFSTETCCDHSLSYRPFKNDRCISVGNGYYSVDSDRPYAVHRDIYDPGECFECLSFRPLLYV